MDANKNTRQYKEFRRSCKENDGKGIIKRMKNNASYLTLNLLRAKMLFLH